MEKSILDTAKEMSGRRDEMSRALLSIESEEVRILKKILALLESKLK